MAQRAVAACTWLRLLDEAVDALNQAISGFGLQLSKDAITVMSDGSRSMLYRFKRRSDRPVQPTSFK
jgi:hypothetical protein